MKNGILYGSFNPLHNSHITLIEEGLKHFDILHIFIRSVPKDDIVDYATKRKWLEKLNEPVGGNLRIYPLEFPPESIRPDGSLDLVKIFLSTQELTGSRIDGMISGGDKDVWLQELKPAFPDREFIVIPRSTIRSHTIRSDGEALKQDVPDYVYHDISGGRL